MAQNPERDVPTLTGAVNWFDPGKGFGFVISDDPEMDILLHTNVLRNYGQNSVADGVEFFVRAHKTERGIQTSEILSITAWAEFNAFGM